MNLYLEIFSQFSIAIVAASILAAYYLRLKDISAYTRKFSFTMVAVSFLMVAILNSVGGSIAVSISLFGALSLLRFRSLVRDTDDMAFLFVALASGLAAGTGNFLIAIAILVCFCLLVFVFKFLEQHEADKDLIHVDIITKGDINTNFMIKSIRELEIKGLALVSISENLQKSLNRYRFKCNQSEEQALLVLDQIKQMPGILRCTVSKNEAP